jgi:hypothetical protein
MRSPVLIAVAAAALVGCSDSETITSLSPEFARAEGSQAGGLGFPATYEITISNIASGAQFLTPPIVALHQGAENIFTVGKAASFELKEIAENGNLAPMEQALDASLHVSEWVKVTGPTIPPVLPGESVTVSLTAQPGSNFVSFASMLICTNDGFTGVDGLKLPKKIGQEVEQYLGAYDAGTEINTEDFADMVPPCQGLSGVMSDDEGTGASNPDLAENGVIDHHPGIVGGVDLVPEVHGWNDPIATITVRRTG